MTLYALNIDLPRYGDGSQSPRSDVCRRRRPVADQIGDEAIQQHAAEESNILKSYLWQAQVMTDSNSDTCRGRNAPGSMKLATNFNEWIQPPETRPIIQNHYDKNKYEGIWPWIDGGMIGPRLAQ